MGRASRWCVLPLSSLRQGLGIGGLAACLLMLGSHGTVQAGKPPNVTPGELALLPKYCPDTMGFNYGDSSYNTSPRAPYWVARLGLGFWAVHHHCWALIKVRRAMLPATPPEMRSATLSDAIDDFYYVVKNTPPDFLLLPDVFMKIGDTHVLQGQVVLAGEAYARSRSLKPTFWPVYIPWAKQLEKSGNRKGALLHLEEGMRASPAALELQAMYKTLGGNPEAFLASLPAAVATPAASSTSADAADAATRVAPSMSAKP